MELEPPTNRPELILQLGRDARPRVPEPPPVVLVAIEDVVLTTAGAEEKDLDAFYVGLLRFVPARRSAEEIVYRAENADIIFTRTNGSSTRADYRAVGVELWHFHEVLETIKATEMEHELQRGLAAGQRSVLVRDPAGNYVSITSNRPVQ